MGRGGLLGFFTDPGLTGTTAAFFSFVVGGALIALVVARALYARMPELRALPFVKSFVAWSGAQGRRTAVVVGLLACLGTGTAYFYGTRNDGKWIHNWDIFHTVMTAKYLDELGYFRLYECAFVFDHEGPKRMKRVELIRDPRTHELRTPEQVLADNECHERFTDARRQAFVDDLEYFHHGGLDWRRLMRDKGYNGTPVYTALAGFPFRTATINYDNLFRAAQLDVLLILVALLFLQWAFGIEVAIVAALFFFVSFPNRYTHMGGSILRFDYVAALMAGLGAMKLRRHELAGALFAWACMERVFPVLFVGAYGLKVLAEIVTTKKIPAEALRFAAGFVVVAAGLFLFSLAFGGGWPMWLEWWDDIRAHTAKTAAFRIGLKHFFMWSAREGRDGLQFLEPAPEHFAAWGRYLYWPVVLVLLGAYARLVKKLDDVTFTAAFGFAAFYALLIATRYYYSVEVVLVLLAAGLFLAADYTLLVGAMFIVSGVGHAVLASGEGWPHIAMTYWWVYGGLVGGLVVGTLLVLQRVAGETGAPPAPVDVGPATTRFTVDDGPALSDATAPTVPGRAAPGKKKPKKKRG